MENGILDGAILEAMRKLPMAPVSDEPNEDEEPDGAPPKLKLSKRCAAVDGFTVHANTVVASNNRIGLEKLCRYGMRGPFAQERLSLTEDGRVRIGLQKPWPSEGGVTVLDYSGVEFLCWLTALIPPPFSNFIRYHGLFGPRAKLQRFAPRSTCARERHSAEAEIRAAGAALLKAKVEGKSEPPHPEPVGPTQSERISEEKQAQKESETLPTTPAKGKRPKRKVFSWAGLLRRIFAIEILVALKCGGDMELLAYITEAAVVEKILTHSWALDEPLPLAPARLPSQLSFFDEQETSPLSTYLSRRGRSQSSRAPPKAADGDWVVEIEEPSSTGDWGA